MVQALAGCGVSITGIRGPGFNTLTINTARESGGVSFGQHRVAVNLVVDGDVIDMVLEQAKDNPKKILEVEKMLRLRLGEHRGDPKYKAFAEKLDELRRQWRKILLQVLTSFAAC